MVNRSDLFMQYKVDIAPVCNWLCHIIIPFLKLFMVDIGMCCTQQHTD